MLFRLWFYFTGFFFVFFFFVCVFFFFFFRFEPPHDKLNKVTVRPAKTQISLWALVVFFVLSSLVLLSHFLWVTNLARKEIFCMLRLLHWKKTMLMNIIKVKAQESSIGTFYKWVVTRKPDRLCFRLDLVVTKCNLKIPNNEMWDFPDAHCFSKMVLCIFRLSKNSEKILLSVIFKVIELFNNIKYGDKLSQFNSAVLSIILTNLSFI